VSGARDEMLGAGLALPHKGFSELQPGSASVKNRRAVPEIAACRERKEMARLREGLSFIRHRTPLRDRCSGRA